MRVEKSEPIFPRTAVLKLEMLKLDVQLIMPRTPYAKTHDELECFNGRRLLEEALAGEQQCLDELKIKKGIPTLSVDDLRMLLKGIANKETEWLSEQMNKHLRNSKVHASHLLCLFLCGVIAYVIAGRARAHRALLHSHDKQG